VSTGHIPHSPTFAHFPAVVKELLMLWIAIRIEGL